MSTFMTVSTTFTALFIAIVLVVDHVERSRAARIKSDETLQEWKAAFDEMLAAKLTQRDDAMSKAVDLVVEHTERENKIMRVLNN